MELSRLNPFVRYARAHKVYLAAEQDRSVCYDCRLFYLESGAGRLHIGETEYNISSGTVIYLPPRTVYGFGFEKPDNLLLLTLNFDLVDDYAHLSASLRTATPKSYDPACAPAYDLPGELSRPLVRMMPQQKQRIALCTDLFLRGETYHREQASALVKLCLLDLLRDDGSGESELCRQVLACIHEHYAEPELSNEQIAARFSYHPYYLSSLVKLQTGRSLHQYLLWYRIQIAKNYLLTTDYSVEEISWKSGFGTAAYFIKLFREHTGTTPGRYRRQKLSAEL